MDRMDSTPSPLLLQKPARRVLTCCGWKRRHESIGDCRPEWTMLIPLTYCVSHVDGMVQTDRAGMQASEAKPIPGARSERWRS